MVHKMRKITSRQIVILDFINLYIAKYKKGPTLREIGEGFGIHINTALGHVEKLIQKEYIVKVEARRGIHLTEKAICFLKARVS